MHPGFFEYEHEAVKAARALKAEEVDLVVVVELAYQKGLIPMRALLELDVPLVIWNSQLVDEFAEGADFDLIMMNSGMAGLPELTSALLRAEQGLLHRHREHRRRAGRAGARGARPGRPRRGPPEEREDRASSATPTRG